MPTKTTRPEKDFYDFIEMCNEIDKVLGYDQRECGKHFYPETGKFDDWCNSKGYGEEDSEGLHRGSSQIWFKEYQQDILEEKWLDTPYMDFWHWQMDNCIGDDFSNDSYSTINIHPNIAKNAEDWQKEIQQVWYDTFKDIANEDGEVPIWVCW